MYQIHKQRIPASLTEYILQNPNHASYENLPSQVKSKIKQALLNEQGYVCAYCMSRIRFDNMKIEHWASQKANPSLELDFKNMLACCQGNEGKPKENQTCDTRKGDEDLNYSPSNLKHKINSRIGFLGNGKIFSNDTDFNTQLEKVLNLNESRLVSNRKAMLETVHNKFSSKQGMRNKSEIERLIDKISQRNSNNELKPFFAVALLYLQKKLTKNQ